MRIKVKGNVPIKQLCLLLMKTLNENNIHEVSGASLYVGSDQRTIEVSYHDEDDLYGRS